MDRPTGNLDIDQNGFASYTFPIEVPPGIGTGNSPHLSIDYRYGGSNGPLGFGWSLGGMSAIWLISPTFAVDQNNITEIQATYRYALDGSELVCISGGYGSPGSLYNTEVDSGLIITFDGSSFTVTDRYGRVKRYGATANSQVTDGNSTTIQWQLTTSADFWGNYVSYNYTTTPRLLLSSGPSSPLPQESSYIDNIVYTCNDNANNYQGKMTVQFIYNTRPDNVVRTVYGTLKNFSYLLTSIQTNVVDSQGQSNVARTYNLAYQQSQFTQDSLLSSITELGSNGTALNPTIFNYTGTAVLNNNVFSATSPQTLNDNDTSVSLLPTNISGRSMADIALIQLNTSSGNMSVSPFLAEPQNTTPQTISWQQQSSVNVANIYTPITSSTLPTTLVADVDSDGRNDLVIAYKSISQTLSFAVLMSAGAGFQEVITIPSGQSWSASKCIFIAMDCNGNGLTDIVQIFDDPSTYQKSINVYYDIANATSTSPPTMVPTISWTDLEGTTTIEWVPINFQRNGTNGLLRITNVVQSAGTNLIQATIFTSSGPAFGQNQFQTLPIIPLTSYNTANTPNLQVLALDVNGDGVQDILCCEVVSDDQSLVFTFTTVIFDGNDGFAPPNTTTSKLAVATAPSTGYFYSTNINGSQYPGVAYVYQDSLSADWICVMSQGTSTGLMGPLSITTIASSSMVPYGTVQLVPADVTGLGQSGWLAYVIQNGSCSVCPVYNIANITDYLSTVTSPYGLTQEISYAPLSSSIYQPTADYATYTTDNNTSDVPCFSSTFNAVSKVSEFNNTALSALPYESIHTYTYTGGMISRGGRGWLGFQSLSRVNITLGIEIVTTYDQSWPTAGEVLQQDTYGDFHDALVQRTQTYPFVWATQQPLGLLQSVYKVYAVLDLLPSGSSPQIYLIQLSSEQTVTFDEDGSKQRSFGTNYQYALESNDKVLEQTWEFDDFNQQLDSQCWTRWQYNSPNSVMISVPSGRKVSSSGTNVDFTTFEPGDLSLTQIGYNEQDIVATTAEWSTDVSAFTLTNHTYDSFGNETLTINAAGLQTATAYDSVYNTFPISVTETSDGGINETTYKSFDPRYGTTFAVMTSYSAISVWSTDEWGRKWLSYNTSTTPSTDDQVIPLPTVLTSSSSFLDLLQSNKFAPASTITYNIQTSPQGALFMCRSTATYYDSSRPTSPASELIDCKQRTRGTISQDNALGPIVWQYKEFDSSGNLVLETFPMIMDPSTTLDSLPNSTTYQACQIAIYDALKRPAIVACPPKITTGSFSIVDITYSNGGGTVSKNRGECQLFGDIIVPGGVNSVETVQTQLRRYLGRQLLSSLQINDLQPTVYSQDPFGNMLTATDGGNATETRTYNAQGSILVIDNPYQNPLQGSFAIQRSYDNCNRMIQEVNAMGETATFSHDAKNRLVTRNDFDGRVTTYTYDETIGGLLVSISINAMVSGSLQLESQVDYTYDGRGRVASKQWTLGNNAPSNIQPITYVYDRQNQVISQGFPDTTALTRQYAGNRLQELTMTGPPKESWNIGATYADYSVYDRPTSWVLSSPVNTSSGLEVNANYDSGGNIIELSLANAGAALVDKLWTYDTLDKITTWEETVSVTSASYTYTDRRLTVASDPNGTRSYSYDASGNITSNNSMNLTYVVGQDSVTVQGLNGSSEVYNCEFDAAGRMIQRQASQAGTNFQFNYDGNGKIRTVNGPGVSQTCITDANARTIQKVSATVNEIYVDALFQMEIYSDGSQVVRRRFLDDTRLLGSVSATYPASNGQPVVQVDTYMTDSKGTITHVFNSAGALQAQLQYDDFGALLAPTTLNDDSASATFEAKETDLNTGLIDLGARWYDPVLGRFTVPDSVLNGTQLINIDGLNRMVFEGNDPINHVDPTGHFSWSWSGFWEGVGAGAEAAGMALVSAIAAPVMVPLFFVFGTSILFGIGPLGKLYRSTFASKGETSSEAPASGNKYGSLTGEHQSMYLKSKGIAIGVGSMASSMGGAGESYVSSQSLPSATMSASGTNLAKVGKAVELQNNRTAMQLADLLGFRCGFEMLGSLASRGAYQQTRAQLAYPAFDVVGLFSRTYQDSALPDQGQGDRGINNQNPDRADGEGSTFASEADRRVGEEEDTESDDEEENDN